MKRPLASCLAALFIFSTPGLTPYQALAQSMAARPVGHVDIAPVLTLPASVSGLSPLATLAPALTMGPSLGVPSILPRASLAPNASIPAAVTPAQPAVQALQALTATPNLAEDEPALQNFYDQTGSRDAGQELDPVPSAASRETRSGLTPRLPAARPETSVIGAARTPKGYARAAGRRLADAWPYYMIGAAAVLAQHLFGPEAAFSVMMYGGACAAFRAVQDGEAIRLGITDEKRLGAAMAEMQQIFRQFGRDAAREGGSNPEIQSRVDAEIMTRSALQGVTHSLEHFLKIIRAEELELPAAKERLRQLVRSAVVGALKVNGMPGDDESMIQKILDKTGLTTMIMDWESRHTVVESMLAAVRAEKKKAAASAPGASAGAMQEKERQAGKANPLLLGLILVGGSLLAAAGHGWALPTAFSMMGPIAFGGNENKPQQTAQAELTPLPDTPMVRHLQLAGYNREEIGFFLSATRDVAEAPVAPVEGRHEEIRRAIETLSRPDGRPRSLLLVGPDGVGKRALVEMLAREIAEKRYKGLEDARVLEFDASSAVGGDVEGLALRLRALLAKSKGRVLLYIDGPGQLKNQDRDGHSFFKILAPFMSRGEVTLIVAADAAEHRQLEDSGPFPFETVELTPPSRANAAAMIEAHAPAFSQRYGLRAAPGLFEAATQLAARYLAKTALPGAGLDLLERAYSARSSQSRANRAEAEFRRRLERVARNLRRLKEDRDDAETAMRRRNATSEDLDELYRLKDVIAAISAEPAAEGLVREADLAEEASRLSGIPASKMLQSEREKLLGLESKLKSRVIHQDQAVTAVAEAVRRARAGLKDPNKPIGSFLFLGPTGVGKTELTKALAETLFDSEANMIRLDMSEYMEKHSVSRLIGSPPGYIGHDAGGQLTEAVRAKPYSVVLLDEVEKAHPDVLNVLLQAMDDGRVTDGQGRTVAFGNVIFVLTSNLGSAHIMELMKDGADRAKINDDVMGAVRQHFRPEFINRLDETVIFNPLGREQAGPIVDIHLNAKVSRWLSDQGIELERASEAAVGRLAELGFDPLYGGRPLARAVQDFVLNPLSVKLLAESSDDERVRPRRKAVLDVVDGVITPRLENLPAEAVAERVPQNAAAGALWRSLLERPQAELGTEAVEAFLFGPPEKDLPSKAHGAFKPMGPLLGGLAAQTIAAASDDPNLKDAELDRATKLWSDMAGLEGDAAAAFSRWMSKVARCAKATNNLRPAPHDPVTYSVHQRAFFREYRVTALPLTRAELILNARIFENHYSKDSASEDQSWEFADELLTRGEYGRAELFEIKRLISAIPGAEFGYWSDRQGLTFWLRLPSGNEHAPAAKPVEASAPPVAAKPAKPIEAPVAKPVEALLPPAAVEPPEPAPIVFDEKLAINEMFVKFEEQINPTDRSMEIDYAGKEGSYIDADQNGFLMKASSPGRAVDLAKAFAAKAGTVEVRLSVGHRFDAAFTQPSSPLPVGADDSEADAPSKYRHLTQDAPAHMRKLHALTAGLLSATDPITVFWGFRFARAALGEKGFEAMLKFLPPLGFLNLDARNAYLSEETLRPYYQDPVSDHRAERLVVRALGGERYSGENQTEAEAANVLSLGGTLPAALSKRFVDGIVSPYARFVRSHFIHILARRLTWPLWTLAAGVAVLPFIYGGSIFFLAWPTWLRMIASAAALGGIIATSVAGFGERLYMISDGAYDRARPKLGIARAVAPRLQPADRARLADHFEAVLRGRWAANKQEATDNYLDVLRDAHWSAARGLEDLRAELKPGRIRKIAAFVLSRAERPSKRSPNADRMAPLMMLELLDDAQKNRALVLALDHVSYDSSPETGRFLRLAREGRLPADRIEGVIQKLVKALGVSAIDVHSLGTPTIAAMSETLAALVADRPDDLRLATFEAAFGVRNQFTSVETTEKPVEYYAALRRLSPHHKAFERIADHLLASTRPKIDQLSWLLSQPDLDGTRRALVIEQIEKLANEDPRVAGVWNAIPVYARLADIPRERRVKVLLNALDWLTSRYNLTDYARAAEAARLLAELETER